MREALAKLFQQERPGDSQYIVIAVGVTTELVQDVTADPNQVLNTLESKHFERLFLASKKQSMDGDLRIFQTNLENVRDACRSKDPACKMKKAMLPSEARKIAASERVENEAFLGQLRAAVQVLSRGKERRTMILVSDGFHLVPGTEAYELMQAYFPELPGGFETVDRMPELEPILRLAANNNIPIYTIDARGLYTPGFLNASTRGPGIGKAMSTSEQEAGNALHEIAAATGGTAFQNSNDILSGLQRAFADGREYYVLSYVPSSSNADGKFHSISVQLRNTKLLVQAKRGYWADSN